MKLENISQADLESMNYDDIAYIILTEENKKMKINDLFRKICDVLNLDDNAFENQIADFFEIMTTDKRFTMLEDGYWDLRINHSQQIVMDDDYEDTDEEEIEDDEDDEIDEENEDIFYDENSDDDEAEDDLKDLVVIDEEEANE
jgi:DNA-directed RNA polymerase delta subunit